MTEPAHLAATRATYDTVAESYARLIPDLRAESALDRALLETFAREVRGKGPVLEAGCGAGRMTAHLAGLGLEISGVDLSPRMVGVARRTYPGLRFEVGSLTALDVADGALAGVLAWYSLIHLPPAELPAALAELARVLAPGGRLLAAFQAGDEHRAMTTAYGHPVSCDVWRLPPERVAALVEEAGLEVTTRLVRAPEGRERVPQAGLLARRPG